ncbi:glycosyltransferase [bacterium]|nr:glycosyltransferase [bacterium]
MNDRTPRVTVGIPVYRGEKHILEAIASVRADTFSDWEILVFDDCSPDSSIELVAEIPDTRIRILSSPTNLGLVNARNRILEDARGEFLAWLDQDDLNYPGRLSMQVAFLDEHPDVSLLASSTDVRVESEDGSFRTFKHARPSTHAAIRAAMPFTNPIACNTVMMRKKHFQQARLSFRQEFGNTLDYDLWSRASDNLTLHALKQPLGAYRMHSQQTSQGLELQKMNQHALQVQIDFLHRNLNIVMSEEERNLHAQLTHIAIQVTDRRILESAKAWFAKLREANLISQLIDQQAFDLVITQQWFRVVNSSPELSPPEKLGQGLGGAREIGIEWGRTFRALYSAFVQRHVMR